MAMVVRGNFRYYYRSKRVGGKVTRIYCGAQEAADKAAEDHKREQEAKRQRREERIAHNAGCRDLLNRINQQLLIFHHEMFELGWHKPRGGPWRRRNARTTKLAPIPGIPTRPLLPNWLKEIADPTVGRGGIVPRHLSNTHNPVGRGGIVPRHLSRTDNPVGRGGIVPWHPSNTDQPYGSEWVVPRLPQVQCSTKLETLPNLPTLDTTRPVIRGCKAPRAAGFPPAPTGRYVSAQANGLGRPPIPLGAKRETHATQGASLKESRFALRARRRAPARNQAAKEAAGT